MVLPFIPFHRIHSTLRPRTPKHGSNQYGLLTILDRLRLGPGARDALVGRLRFFLLMASTSFCNATI